MYDKEELVDLQKDELIVYPICDTCFSANKKPMTHNAVKVGEKKQQRTEAALGVVASKSTVNS